MGQRVRLADRHRSQPREMRMNRNDPRQRRGGIPANAHNVPIIGQGPPWVEAITFELGPFKFHPPKAYDHVYVMMMTQLASQQPAVLKVIHAFQQPGAPLAQVYLAEDCDLGKAHELVMVSTDEEGQLGFLVARPVEDDPAAKDPKH